MDKAKKKWAEVEKFVSGYETEIKLPSMITQEITEDFKHFLFSLSRYKFAGKMLEGKKSVLEIGCNVGLKTTILSQFVDKVIGLDYEETAIESAKNMWEDRNRTFICADILNMEPLIEKVDAAVSLDVIEHIEKKQEEKFMEGIIKNIGTHGVCIIGTPNVTAADYQSKTSKMGHINLYSHEELKKMMNKYFYNTFMFAMNDEVVHTGFLPMAHYLIAVGVGVINNK